jgi:predicted RecA/RadA family phage recombinase
MFRSFGRRPVDFVIPPVAGISICRPEAAVGRWGSGFANNSRASTEFSATAATTLGAKDYWDDSAKDETSTATSNTPIGAAIAVPGNGDATVAVRLHV